MNKRIVNLAIGLGVALIVIMMIQNYIASQRQLIEKLLEEGKAVKIVIAKVDIAKDTIITADMVSLKTEPKASMQPGDLTSLESAIGSLAVVDILRGQHINSNMLQTSTAFKFLSQSVPTGMRAFTISVDQLSGIEGLIKPGDYVDVIGTFRFPTGREGESMPIVVTLLQGIKVLASNRIISPYQVPQKAGTITLALKPEDARVLAYALTIGSIKLVLRAPLDSSVEYESNAITFEALLKKMGMYIPQPPTVAPPPTVEVYRGSSKKEEKTFK